MTESLNKLVKRLEKQAIKNSQLKERLAKERLKSSTLHALLKEMADAVKLNLNRIPSDNLGMEVVRPLADLEEIIQELKGTGNRIMGR